MIKYRIFYTIVFTVQFSVSVVYDGCGGIFVNIRYFTEIMISYCDNDICGASDMLKNTYWDIILFIVLNILITIRIMRQVDLF